MKTPRAMAAGFSLVEVALALAIFAAVGAMLVGILGTSLTATRDILTEAEKAMLVENIQARLTLDAGWPGSREAAWFDDSGSEVDTEREATFRVAFAPVPGAGFSSDYFETFAVTVERLPQRQPLGVWPLQRARLAAGEPVAAE